MNTTIYLFYNLTPNSRNGIYDCPNKQLSPPAHNGDDTWGKQYLEILCARNEEKFPLARERFATLRGRSYLIYDTYIDISLTETDYYNPSEYAFITYLAIVPDKGKYLFYHVTNFQLLPSKIRLYVTVDNWANYIAYSQLSDITITGTNLIISDNLLYLCNSDKINNEVIENLLPIKKSFNSIYDNISLTYKSLVIYAVISYSVSENTTLKTTSDRIEVIVFDYYELVKDNPNLNITSFIDCIRAISSIYGYGNNTTDYLPAQVQKIFIYDRSFKTSTLISSSGFIAVDNNANPIFLSYRRVINTQYQFTYTIGCGNETYLNNKNIDLVYANPGLKGIAGPRSSGYEIPNYVGIVTIKFEARINNDIQILVSTPNGSKDISTAFQVAVTRSNNIPLTAYEQMAKSLSTISNIVSGGAQIVGGIASTAGGNLGGITAIASGSLALGNTFIKENINQYKNPTAVANGNAFLTYKNLLINTSDPNPEEYSFYLTLYGEAKGNEQGADISVREQIKVDGAACEYRLSNVLLSLYNSFFEYITALNTDQRYLVPNIQNPYIQATLTINNIPDAAADDIQAKFNEGVRLNIVTIEN